MPRKHLIRVALMAICALSATGGAFAEGECARVSTLPEPQRQLACGLGEERRNEKCYRCEWKASGCSSRDQPDNCISGILKFNAKGAEVTGLQELLKSKGFDVKATGKFDTQTKKAVESFQKQQNIPMDGKINPETLGKLLGTNKPGSTK